MNKKTIYWHDYETFGSDPRRHRACQFAGLRTDEDLNVIGEAQVIYCKPSLDVIPDPEACLVTGISPLQALEKGLTEAQFCARIAEEFSTPGTCVAGYNNIRFDDEVTRHLFYRCFHDPYEREWKHGNSRWDIIDLVRLTHALRPEGINWPRNEDGSPSFRLEELTRANKINHEGAHDALSDVTATIALARLIRDKQPRLFDYYYRQRFKQAVLPLLDIRKARPLIHVSSMYPAAVGCMAVVLPLARHPHNGNGVIVYDLACDPSPWLGLDPEAIRHRLFGTREELLEAGVERVALKTVHANKCPALAPLGVATEEVIRRWDIDLEACRRHQDLLSRDAGVADKVAAVFAEPPAVEADMDPDQMLYSGGFFSDADRGRMAQLKMLGGAELAGYSPFFEDPRLPEMLFRYRCRNYPDTLRPEERQRWLAYCKQLLLVPAGDDLSTVESIRARVDALSREASSRDKAVLADLTTYLDGACRELGLAEAASL